MTAETDIGRDPRFAAAIDRLTTLIREGFPAATFEIAEDDDPTGTYLWATVDTEDPDGVLDLVGEYLLDVQVEPGLPIYVVPIRVPERVLATLERPALKPDHLADNAFPA